LAHGSAVVLHVFDHLVEHHDVQCAIPKREAFAGREHDVARAALAGAQEPRPLDVAAVGPGALPGKCAYVLTHSAAEVQHTPALEGRVALDDRQAALLTGAPHEARVAQAGGGRDLLRDRAAPRGITVRQRMVRVTACGGSPRRCTPFWCGGEAAHIVTHT